MSTRRALEEMLFESNVTRFPKDKRFNPDEIEDDVISAAIRVQQDLATHARRIAVDYRLYRDDVPEIIRLISEKVIEMYKRDNLDN